MFVQDIEDEFFEAEWCIYCYFYNNRAISDRHDPFYEKNLPKGYSLQNFYQQPR